ncbi:Transglycosylase SLT domain-containing protein [Thermanaeromonas toyohensis ToBE]|uniref:Transglycosylase SLT domain-containing protein n=1 Tax=Thermanaeromonas toyohensis ToBE TaxID=698762 RepID=A0A1W1VSR8_9FIRM|nr:peptidoglycan DD-metalloendopeptidase family protein [Thermanaeromonas toyohensis]SMB96398.1 Transglycosylase SLT domain-containing protein [Thermanaeromonas toyohensis ToBE]
MDDIFERARRQAVSAVRSFLLRRLLASLLSYLAPYLLPIAAAVFMVFTLLLLVAAVYEVMAPMRLLSGVVPAATDEKLVEQYQKLCDEYNVKETWLVPGEAQEGKTYYPGKGISHIGRLADRYHNDRKLALTWGAIHAPSLYWTFANGAEEIPDRIKKVVAEELRPYFYYKTSEVIVISKKTGDVVSRQTVHLLVEACTYTGLYQYYYEPAEEETDEFIIKYERLLDVKQVWENPFQRLDEFLKEHFGEGDRSIELARTAILEAGQAFSRKEKRLAWLISTGANSILAVSAAMVPPELMPFFKEAEKKYGIPWWFLAAVALRESSFDPNAVNKDTKCFGVMQVSPDNWAHYAPLLGFDPEKDKFNPRAQIMVGAYLLYEQGLKDVDWNGNWQERAAPVLAFYVGAGTGEEAVQKAYAMGYIPDIYAYAERFRVFSTAVWPVPSSREITDTYHPEATLLRRAHHGIDIAASLGADVVSVSAGKVETTAWDDTYGYYIDISDGIYRYRYAHLSSILVNPGQDVSPGDVIGLVGSTGKSTGPHLHFEVHDLAVGHTIDPLLVLVK